ncbi:MAG: PspC domain-containing protein, partial [Paludibacteraceae bacterium]|nr:PspC domain-containing protein [Paludibacteraceae bacterium]
TVVRVAYAVLSVFSTGFPGLLLYLILMIIMPANANAE